MIDISIVERILEMKKCKKREQRTYCKLLLILYGEDCCSHIFSELPVLAISGTQRKISVLDSIYRNTLKTATLLYKDFNMNFFPRHFVNFQNSFKHFSNIQQQQKTTESENTDAFYRKIGLTTDFLNAKK